MTDVRVLQIVRRGKKEILSSAEVDFDLSFELTDLKTRSKKVKEVLFSSFKSSFVKEKYLNCLVLIFEPESPLNSMLRALRS